jgi:hypothetical protein
MYLGRADALCPLEFGRVGPTAEIAVDADRPNGDAQVSVGSAPVLERLILRTPWLPPA